jgi:thioredoxin reductase
VVPPGTHPGALHRQALERLDHVELLEGYEPRAIGGDTFVTSLTAAREHDVRELAVEAVFVELGLAPNSAIVRQLAELDPAGFVRVDSRNRTSVAGLFAAGDVTATRAEHVLVAMGDGARAAISACEDLLFSQ